MAPVVAAAARPASAFDPLALLDAVQAVAAAGHPDEPESVSTRAWDAARPLSDRYADAPPARRICEHLGLPWTKVRELAFMAPAGRAIALGHALNERQGDWLTPQHSDFALKVVARRLGVPTLTPGQYRAERVRMLAADRRRGHGGDLRLPTEHQIAALAGSWDRAVAHAGLRARQGRGGHRARLGPASIVDVLDRCFEHHRAEPTAAELETFARANGIPFPPRQRGRPWSDYVREWKEGRRGQGLPVPDGRPPKRQRPDYGQDVGAAVPGERRGRRAWNDVDEVAAWVARYLDDLPPGDQASQRGYDTWARGRDGAPWSSNFDQHGGWSALLARARKTRRP